MTTKTEHLRGLICDTADELLRAEGCESVSIPMGDRLILAGNPSELARMLGYSDTLAIFAATKRATRFWSGVDTAGHLAQLWTVEPRAEDYPHLTITAHVIMPQVDNGTPAGWEPADAPIAAAVPAGWKLVPIEPTESMAADGFAAWPDEHFSDSDVWDAYEALSGCQQAAYRARVCYTAMLAAAPLAPSAAAVTESQPAALTDAQIDALWKTMDGDKNWLRTFGYQQFARAVLDLAAPRCKHCDGTGDVHDITGEWLGACECEAGAAVYEPAAPVPAAAEGWRAKLEQLVLDVSNASYFTGRQIEEDEVYSQLSKNADAASKRLLDFMLASVAEPVLTITGRMCEVGNLESGDRGFSLEIDGEHTDLTGLTEEETRAAAALYDREVTITVRPAAPATSDKAEGQ